MTPRHSARQRCLLVIAALFVFLSGHVASLPAQEPNGLKPRSSTYRDIDYSMTPEEQRTVFTLGAVTSLWFLAIGCCVGSFLNVVVYRLPLGLPVGLPRSRCPKCQNAIEPRDNIPIIGWLRLRGRCRSCQLPISARYPLIEAAIGGLFLALLHRELLSGGANLPVRDPNTYNGVVWILWYTKWDLVGIYLFHLLLLVVLWGAALIEHDGFPWPTGMVGFAAGVGLIMLACWPHLYLVSAWGTQASHWTSLVSGGIGAVTSGLIAGALTKCFWKGPAPEPLSTDTSPAALPPADPRNQLTLSASLAGLFLGWQTGGALAVIAFLCLSLPGGIGHRMRRHAVACFAGLTTVMIFVWRPAYAAWTSAGSFLSVQP